MKVISFFEEEAFLFGSVCFSHLHFTILKSDEKAWEMLVCCFGNVPLQIATNFPPPSHQIRISPEKSEFDAKGVLWR